jgi:soluble lytic murein transglycosylase
MKAINEQPVKHGYELAYQKPYMKQVEKEAAEYNVDQNLIWALMREESYFNAGVYSKAGAGGLMQIMPDTGKYIASRLDVPFNDKDLLDPDVNIRFGTYYLKSMLDMFSGDVDKALASYNGGSGNVNKWSSTRIGGTRNGFPTSITFLETREYVTKVEDSYYFYKVLYK